MGVKDIEIRPELSARLSFHAWRARRAEMTGKTAFEGLKTGVSEGFRGCFEAQKLLEVILEPAPGGGEEDGAARACWRPLPQRAGEFGPHPSDVGVPLGHGK